MLVGCAFPQWRFFQKTVDAKLAERPADQVEAERRAAAFIRVTSETPWSDMRAQLEGVHRVAVPLSASLGEPKQPVAAADEAAVIASLRVGLLAEQKKAEQWRAFAKKYAGAELENTGINLAGPAGLVVLVGIVAACIACPALGYVALRVVPLLWGFFRTTTKAIGDFVQAHPDAGEELKATLSRRMDRSHKSLVQHYVTRRKPLAA